MVKSFRNPVDLSGMATKAELDADMVAINSAMAGKATTSALSAVQASIPSISGLATQSALTAVQASIPSISGLATTSALSAVAATVPPPADGAPPAVSDASAKGSITKYAMENHTHASKLRKIRDVTAADGSYTWTYATPFDVGVVPIILGVAETTVGNTDIINLQVEGTPTATSCKVRVTRTNRSVVALIGLTVLSLPASPGATPIHLVAISNT